MLKEDERRIGAHLYRVTQLPVPEGIKTSTRLLRMIGPALAELLRGSRGKLELSAEGVAGAIEGIVASLSEEDLAALCAVFAKRTLVVMDSGKSPTLESMWEVHFAGAYDEMFRWLAFCVEVNFKSFFVAAGSLADLARREEKASP